MANIRKTLRGNVEWNAAARIFRVKTDKHIFSGRFIQLLDIGDYQTEPMLIQILSGNASSDLLETSRFCLEVNDAIPQYLSVLFSDRLSGRAIAVLSGRTHLRKKMRVEGHGVWTAIPEE